MKICQDCACEYENKSGRSKFCKSCSSSKNYRKKWNVLKTDKNIRMYRLMHAARNRAKAKNLPYNITVEYLIKLWNENDGCCSLTGIPFKLDHSGTAGQVHPDAPSVDRIVPKLGYVEGNIRLVTYHMNVALAEWGIEGFERLALAYSRLGAIA